MTGLAAPGTAWAIWIESGADAKSPTEAASGTTQKRRKTVYDSGFDDGAQVRSEAQVRSALATFRAVVPARRSYRRDVANLGRHRGVRIVGPTLHPRAIWFAACRPPCVGRRPHTHRKRRGCHDTKTRSPSEPTDQTVDSAEQILDAARDTNQRRARPRPRCVQAENRPKNRHISQALGGAEPSA